MARTRQTARARPVFLPPSSSSEEKTVHIHLVDYTVPKFIIHYSNNDELREALQKRLKGLKLAFAVVPEPGLGYEPRGVKDIEGLIAEMDTGITSPIYVKLWCAPAETHAKYGKKQGIAHQPRIRSLSPNRRHIHGSKSSQSYPRFPCCSPAPWLPCWCCWEEAEFSSAMSQPNCYCQRTQNHCCNCTYKGDYYEDQMFI
ncbi:unnamed protein product [Cylicostephanus goldi]|uniref:Uncharacterized protein n=1 Tax=Cylicostephanus goldi TaxID=71465 RepID=A0A3P6SP06_CYLGO|nr:unnamed protein product [Cylicostephanus goldi]